VQPVENGISRRTSELQTVTLAAHRASQRSPVPAGLSTFLFSDIVASTRRWEGDPDAMAVDLAVASSEMVYGVIAGERRGVVM
jgi:class 3 adenylate cyclase